MWRGLEEGGKKRDTRKLIRQTDILRFEIELKVLQMKIIIYD